METTSKRSSQAPTIASVMAVPAVVQAGASGRPKEIPKDEKISSREERSESSLANAEEQRGNIDSYLRDIRHQIEACIENNRAYYEEAGRRWEACQNFSHQSQRSLDRLEQLARQATNQQIRLTHMYQKREEENSMYHVG